MPVGFELSQNYPTPFNPATEITYSLSEPAEVILEVYSIHGQRLAILESGLKSEGEHSVRFDASNHASGIYIYRLRAGEVIKSKKMILLK